MPKMKTRRGAAKRFQQTATGQLKHRSPGRQKKMLSKSPGQKRRLYNGTMLDAGKEKAVSRQLPYGV